MDLETIESAVFGDAGNSARSEQVVGCVKPPPYCKAQITSLQELEGEAMTAWCSSCKQKVETKRIRGKAICCGAYNSLIKLPKVRGVKKK